VRVRRLLFIALLIAAACKSPESKAKKAQDELSSWASAGHALSQDWARGAAPKPYVKSTVDVASDEIEKIGKTLQNDKSVDQVSSLYEQLGNAVERDDRAAGIDIARAFQAISDRLEQSKS
jgi:hypothetical protein